MRHKASGTSRAGCWGGAADASGSSPAHADSQARAELELRNAGTRSSGQCGVPQLLPDRNREGTGCKNAGALRAGIGPETLREPCNINVVKLMVLPRGTTLTVWSWTRAKRLALINSKNSTWQDLSEGWGEKIELQ